VAERADDLRSRLAVATGAYVPDQREIDHIFYLDFMWELARETRDLVSRARMTVASSKELILIIERGEAVLFGAPSIALSVASSSEDDPTSPV
jgi:hypothetical protein